MSNRAYHPILYEIRDHHGVWHTGWHPYGSLAKLIGTTTADLIRRLALLGVVEPRDERHRLTALAKRKSYGTIHRLKPKGNRPGLEIDVILPEGMVLVVRNLETTNMPTTEAERLRDKGLSQRAIAARLGISQPAVKKRLAAVPPRLKNWPIVGSWDDED